MCSEVFQFEKELKWENPGPGIRRQIMGYDEQLMMVKVQFEKGAVGTMHEHHHSQATYVVSGKFELTIGEQKEILSAGVSILVTAFWENADKITILNTNWTLVVLFVLAVFAIRRFRMNPICVMVLAGVVKVIVSFAGL